MTSNDGDIEHDGKAVGEFILSGYGESERNEIQGETKKPM